MNPETIFNTGSWLTGLSAIAAYIKLEPTFNIFITFSLALTAIVLKLLGSLYSL